MKFTSETLLYGIKESKGEYEGRNYSSTTFHLDVDLAENGAGRSLGSCSKPFKFGDASEFEKWIHIKTYPLKVSATFVMEASKGDVPVLKLVDIKPAASAPLGKAV